MESLSGGESDQASQSTDSDSFKKHRSSGATAALATRKKQTAEGAG